MNVTSHVIGPNWSAAYPGRYTGRYPLAVERHVLAQVAYLIPGITSVTPHARYYALHGLIAAETAKRGLSTQQAVELVRRAEVVLAGISIAHQGDHHGMPMAHGGDFIRTAME